MIVTFFRWEIAVHMSNVGCETEVDNEAFYLNVVKI